MIEDSLRANYIMIEDSIAICGDCEGGCYKVNIYLDADGYGNALVQNTHRV